MNEPAAPSTAPTRAHRAPLGASEAATGPAIPERLHSAAQGPSAKRSTDTP